MITKHIIMITIKLYDYTKITNNKITITIMITTTITYGYNNTMITITYEYNNI